jgi:carboxylate-amine ligase
MGGVETGMLSTRAPILAELPRSGGPPWFGSYAAWEAFVERLERLGVAASYTLLWWDIRPHPRLGTVEVRICDGVTRLEDAIAITAYVQALVKLFSERAERGEQIPTYHRILTTENKWLAGRYGLEAPIMDLATGKRNRIPVAQLVRRTLKEIEPHARELGADRELDGIRAILAKGNGSDRQLRVFNANRDIVEVVQEIANATEIAPVAA